MRNLLKENWWKITLVLCAVVVAVHYGYITYRQYMIDNDPLYQLKGIFPKVEAPVTTDNGIHINR